MEARAEKTQTIGEFARQTGLSERALRIYESRGLLLPAFVDPATGYRHYRPDQVPAGRFVAMLRSIDMPLTDIQRVLDAPLSDRADMVAQYWYAVERSLDGRRRAVRRLRSASEEQEQGMSRSRAVVLEGEERGAFAALALLAEIADPAPAGEAYSEAMKEAYWDRKDLSLSVAISYAGVGRLLAVANTASDELAYALRSSAKTIMYDLASFTWVGWDEAEIEIGPAEAAAGLAAARSNLALAVQLEKGELAVSRAHWMLGAHLLTGGEPILAKASFEEARAHALAAGAEVEAELSAAFGLLADEAAGVAGTGPGLEASLERLASFDGGEMFAAQVKTARMVLNH